LIRLIEGHEFRKRYQPFCAITPRNLSLKVAISPFATGETKRSKSLLSEFCEILTNRDETKDRERERERQQRNEERLESCFVLETFLKKNLESQDQGDGSRLVEGFSAANTLPVSKSCKSARSIPVGRNESRAFLVSKHREASVRVAAITAFFASWDRYKLDPLSRRGAVVCIT